MAAYRAVIFDLDGVLWDGEPLYHEAFNVVLNPLGHHLSAEDYAKIIGTSGETAWAWVRDRFGITEPLDRFRGEYDRAVIALMARPIEPLAGVRELLAALHVRRIPVGLASASRRNWVDTTLTGCVLTEAFDVTVTASEVKNSKPAPDLYLKAAEKLGIEPAACIAVEDSISGVQAAKAAGMYTIQSRASSTALPALDTADSVIDAYDQFDLSLLADPQPAK